MRAVPPMHEQPGAFHLVLGEGQPEYIPLPATFTPSTGTMVTEWRPSRQEIDLLIEGAPIRIYSMTFGKPFQPIRVEVAVPPHLEGCPEPASCRCPDAEHEGHRA